MSEENGGQFPVRPVVVLTVALVVVTLLYVFGRGDAPSVPADIYADSHADSLSPAEAVPESQASAQSAAKESASDSVSAQDELLASRAPESSGKSVPSEPTRRAPPMETIPPRVMEAFLRGTAPISDEALMEMQSGMQEIPDDTREEMDNAANRPIPRDVLEAFQNPFAEISEEELEELRQNGLNSARQ